MKKSQYTGEESGKSLSSYVRRLVIVSTIITTVLVAGIICIHEVLVFKKIRTEQRLSYLEEQKDFIKDLIRNEVEYIRNKKEQFDQSIQKDFKQNVTNAYNVAEKLYQQYHNQLSDKELKALIISAVSALDGSSLYSKVFINTMGGYGVYYPGRPENSGVNLIDFVDVDGNHVIQREIEFLKTQPNGFIRYEYNSLDYDKGIQHDKVTFVKAFGHFDWYFGSKGYLEDYYENFKDEIAQKISTIRFRHGGYVFLNEMGGDPIVMNGEVFDGNFNFFDGRDSIKRAVFELQLSTANKSYPDGGYFNYLWEKMDGQELSAKISYVQAFPPTNWMVGAGFYVDEIDSALAAQQQQLLQSLIKNLLQLLFILILVLGVEVLIVFRFDKYYGEDFLHFSRFFVIGKGKYETIDVKKLHFKEFQQMGHIANEMIIEREKTHRQLVKEQSRALESDRLKSAFLANMSHEIRTPMNAILGFSGLIDDPAIDPADKKDFTKIILENGEYLLGLINDIIDLSKIESDQLTITITKFNLAKLIKNIGRHFQEMIAVRKDLKIKLNVDIQLPENYMCSSDEFRLKQVLDNLIGNAIKFTQDGLVELSVSKNDDRIIFKVSDNGIGISENDQVQIFQRFMQANIDLKRNYGGTGLGLAISKNIVELLDGEIGVNSTPGKGSTFYFYIPA